MTDDDLDHLFALARAEAPTPSPGLTARVLADADAARVRPAAQPPRRQPFSLWAALSAAFGGSGVLAGMAAATVAGLYLGFAQPMGADIFVSVLGGEVATIDMMPGIDALLDEAP